MFKLMKLEHSHNHVEDVGNYKGQVKVVPYISKILLNSINFHLNFLKPKKENTDNGARYVEKYHSPEV